MNIETTGITTSSHKLANIIIKYVNSEYPIAAIKAVDTAIAVEFVNNTTAPTAKAKINVITTFVPTPAFLIKLLSIKLFINVA